MISYNHCVSSHLCFINLQKYISWKRKLLTSKPCLLILWFKSECSLVSVHSPHTQKLFAEVVNSRPLQHITPWRESQSGSLLNQCVRINLPEVSILHDDVQVELVMSQQAEVSIKMFLQLLDLTENLVSLVH